MSTCLIREERGNCYISISNFISSNFYYKSSFRSNFRLLFFCALTLKFLHKCTTISSHPSKLKWVTRLSVKKEKLLNQCPTFTNFCTFLASERWISQCIFSHLECTRFAIGDYSVCDQVHQVAHMTSCRLRILTGFSQFKASKANFVCNTLNFLLSGYSDIVGGRVTGNVRVSQLILFVLGQRGDVHRVSKEHSCFSSTLDGYGIG